MSGGKGKSHGGKAGPKAQDGNKTQVSHSAKAGLQVSSSPSTVHQAARRMDGWIHGWMAAYRDRGRAARAPSSGGVWISRRLLSRRV